MMPSQKLLIVYNIPWYFMMRGFTTALAARAEGFEVHVAMPDGPATESIRSAGLDFHPIPLSRSGLNLREELRTFVSLIRLYRRLKPDLVHHCTIKPVVYGGIAARLAGVPHIVQSNHGLGYVFTAPGIRAALLRAGVKFVLRRALGHKHAKVTFLNGEDRDAFISAGILKNADDAVVCPVGLDLKVFRPFPEPEPPPVVILPARFLWDKGVGEFVAAAQDLKARGTKARFVLVGDVDPGNLMTVPSEQIKEWIKDGSVEHWGWQQDMVPVYAQSHIVCLPSYREGLGMVLVEGSACGRALVATNVPGCREVVRHGENGLLVPPRDPVALAQAIGKLLDDPVLRAKMGALGREIAIQKFSEQKIIEQTLAIYRELLGDNSPKAVEVETH